MDTAEPKFIGIAAMGLFFIAAGVIFILGFAMDTAAGMNMPGFLETRSESYNLLMMGIVNIAAAIGLLYRVKSMWSFTLVVVAIMIFGNLTDIFFIGSVKIVVFATYALIAMLLMTNEAKLWYRLK